MTHYETAVFASDLRLRRSWRSGGAVAPALWQADAGAVTYLSLHPAPPGRGAAGPGELAGGGPQIHSGFSQDRRSAAAS